MSSSPEEVSINGYSPRTDIGPNGFTAVNGKGSPPRRVNGINGINGDAHTDSSSTTLDIRTSKMDNPAMDPIRVDSAPAARVSPAEDSNSTIGKRKRSISEGDGRDREQGEHPSVESRRSPQPGAPSTQSQAQPQTAPPSHTQQPTGQQNSWENSPPQGMSRASNHSMSYSQDSESRDSQWYGPSGQRPQSSSNDEATLIETIRNAMPNVGPHGPHSREYMDVHGGTPSHLVSGTIETTAAGVQVDPKKRKRVSELMSSHGKLNADLAF